MCARHLAFGWCHSPELLPAPDPARALVAVMPHANPNLVLLLAPELHPFAVYEDGAASAAIAAFRMQTESAAFLRLRHPLAPRRFLGVTETTPAFKAGRVVFDSLGQSKLNLFERVSLDPAILSPTFHHTAAALCDAAARPMRAAPLFDRLHAGTLPPAFAATLLRVLPRDELAILAAMLLDQPEHLHLLQSALPEDPWFTQALPALWAWHANRAAPPDFILHSPEAETFAADPLEGHGQPQAGFVLTALARGHIAPHRGACLLATARNEGPYLIDWLAYHRAIGFEHTFIYTNDNFDGSNKLLEALARSGAITLVHNESGPNCGAQSKAYAHAMALLPDILDYNWAAILDIDEYMAFDTKMFEDIGDYLAWHETQPVDAVALCWQVFAAARNDMWHDAPSHTRFTMREPSANQHVKSIFRPRKFWGAHMHFPYSTLNAPFVYRAESGGLHYHPGVVDRIPAFSAAPSANLAWINHYWLRSAPEALWKLARSHGGGKASNAKQQLETAIRVCRGFVTLADRTDLVEDRRILTCAPTLDRELAALRALPGVAESETRIKADFATRLKLMAQAFIDQARPTEEPPEFATFREALRQSLKTHASVG